jgi:hypothetical protein
MSAQNHDPDFSAALAEVRAGARRRSWAAFVLIATLLIGLLGVMAFVHISDLHRRLEATHRPTVAGRVIKSSVAVYDSGEGASYSPIVEYSYSVDGRAMVGVQKVHGMFITKASAEDVVRELPAGGDVLVYYDPNDPRDSMVRPGADASDAAMAALLLIMVVGWYRAAVHWLRSRRHEELLSREDEWAA